MYSTPITYTDYNDEKQTEVLHFNMTKIEMIRLAAESKQDGYLSKLHESVKTNDIITLMDYLATIILKSYGEKSDDGRHFIKIRNGHPVSEAFSQSAAYNEFYMDLFEHPEKIVDIFKQIMPSDLSDYIEKNIGKNPTVEDYQKYLDQHDKIVEITE